MMRSLWTAASGMRSQQTNVDIISNNLANVNTIGYKKETAEFKSLLYQTIQSRTTSANGAEKPIGAQVGLGVRNSSITSNFDQGTLTPTENTFDFAIQGQGFFQIMGENGETYYTRNGSFGMAMSTNGIVLANSDGLPVLDVDGQPIILDAETDTSKITVMNDGNLALPDETNNPAPIGVQLGIVQFANPAGLEKIGGSMFATSAASGEPMLEVETDELNKSSIEQGYIESSNVQVVDEMVDLIVAQRAYEMNSKAIQASDEMLSQANALRR